MILDIVLAIFLLLAQAGYFVGSAINLLLFSYGAFNLPQREKIALDELPFYTILLPLYREAKIVAKLVQNIENMLYDKDKLQVLILLEEDDLSTRSALQQLQLDDYFSVIIVPDGQPRTKGRACNYALPLVKGEFVVIYDAEDNPEPEQLLLAVQKFRQSPANVICLQAWLLIDNYFKNWLTAMFAIEYCKHFKFLLAGIRHCNLFISLGGTSNHLKTNVLKQLGGWEAFNVTEDAELGVRLAKAGYCTDILPSFTLEEAPSNLTAWLKQRRRWHKGFMQTFIAHIHHPIKTYKQLGIKNFLFMHYYFGLMMLLPCIAPFLLLICWAGEFHLSSYALQQFILTFSYFNLGFGILVQVGLAYITLRAQHKSVAASIMLSITYPIYLLLHIPATFMAFYQLLTHTHYWDKTEHGNNG